MDEVFSAKTALGSQIFNLSWQQLTNNIYAIEKYYNGLKGTV